jgi:hypothetical protein
MSIMEDTMVTSINVFPTIDSIDMYLTDPTLSSAIATQRLINANMRYYTRIANTNTDIDTTTDYVTTTDTTTLTWAVRNLNDPSMEWPDGCRMTFEELGDLVRLYAAFPDALRSAIKLHKEFKAKKEEANK